MGVFHELRAQRRSVVQRVESDYGRLLDAIDVFIYRGEQLVDAIAALHVTSELDLENPQESRMVCILILARDSLLSMKEMSLMIRSGLKRPLSLSIRRLHEIRVNADFMRLDVSGEVSVRWQHWEIYDRARLDPSNQRAKLEQGTLLRETPYGEGELKRRGHWARLPSGEKYYTLHSRSEFVRERREEEWPLSTYSQEERAEIAEQTALELSRANALIHPTFVGNQHTSSPEVLVSGAALSSTMTLRSYRAVAFDENSRLTLQDEIDVEERWVDLAVAYDGVAVEILGREN